MARRDNKSMKMQYKMQKNYTYIYKSEEETNTAGLSAGIYCYYN